jgi:citrate synthase
LLDLLQQQFPDSPMLALAHKVSHAVQALIDQYPNVDFALAVLAVVLNLPVGTSYNLFALGRTIGWIGHAIEQYSIEAMIRPRATYVGIPPRD